MNSLASQRYGIRDRARFPGAAAGLPGDLPHVLRSQIEMFQLHRRYGKPAPAAFICGYQPAAIGRYVRLVVLIDGASQRRKPLFDDESGGAA